MSLWAAIVTIKTAFGAVLYVALSSAWAVMAHLQSQVRDPFPYIQRCTNTFHSINPSVLTDCPMLVAYWLSYTRCLPAVLRSCCLDLLSQSCAGSDLYLAAISAQSSTCTLYRKIYSPLIVSRFFWQPTTDSVLATLSIIACTPSDRVLNAEDNIRDSRCGRNW